MLTLAFYPVDTWFFRESRPMESLGGTSLGNQFPPSPSTLMGALRTRLGDLIGLNWQQLKQQPNIAPPWWGDAEQPGDLKLIGPWLYIDNQHYFPVPAHLLRQADGNGYVMLSPGKAVICDLGTVRLPTLPAQTSPGVKPLEGHWLEQQDLNRILQGEQPHPNMKTLCLDDLFENEYRLGIGMDTTSRSVIEGQLYQTRHLRPRKDLAVIVNLNGLDESIEQRLRDSLQQQPLLRLGGEGRMAEVRVTSTPPAFRLPKQPRKQSCVMAIALTDMPITKESWPLPGFTHITDTEQGDYWQGTWAEQTMNLVTMATPKVHRQGGWDLLNHKPRAVRSFLPAGTVFFFNHATTLPSSLQIGSDTAWGYGHLVTGWWNDLLKG